MSLNASLLLGVRDEGETAIDTVLDDGLDDLDVSLEGGSSVIVKENIEPLPFSLST